MQAPDREQRGRKGAQGREEGHGQDDDGQSAGAGATGPERDGRDHSKRQGIKVPAPEEVLRQGRGAAIDAFPHGQAAGRTWASSRPDIGNGCCSIIGTSLSTCPVNAETSAPFPEVGVQPGTILAVAVRRLTGKTAFRALTFP